MEVTNPPTVVSNKQIKTCQQAESKNFCFRLETFCVGLDIIFPPFKIFYTVRPLFQDFDAPFLCYSFFPPFLSQPRIHEPCGKYLGKEKVFFIGGGSLNPRLS